MVGKVYFSSGEGRLHPYEIMGRIQVAVGEFLGRWVFSWRWEKLFIRFGFKHLTFHWGRGEYVPTNNR